MSDGVDAYRSFRDNAYATSRVGLDLSRNFGDAQLKLMFEIQSGVPAISANDQSGASLPWEWGEPTVRKAEVKVSSRLGDVSIGQGPMATDGIAAIDLSWTSVVGDSAIRDAAGSFQLRDGASRELKGIRVGDVFDNLDGSRRFRVRYDATMPRGYVLSLAYGTDDLDRDRNDFADAAITKGRDGSAVKIVGGAGLSWQTASDGSDEIEVVGSVSALHHDTGTSLTVAAGAQDEGGSYTYAKLGYAVSLFQTGETRASVDLYLGRDFEFRGSRSRSIGWQLVQAWDARSLDVYFGYQFYSFDDVGGTEYLNVTSSLGGIRWRF